MNQTPKPPIDRLLRGISTNDVETTRDAWRDMLGDGESSVAAVRAKLASEAWQENPRGPLARYLGVLLSALHELDRDAFVCEIARLKDSPLHAHHRLTVDVVGQRTEDVPAMHVNGVPVYISDSIHDRTIVMGNLERWSKTKGLSLDDVTRIDVIARAPELDYLGLYNMMFSGIVLTWPRERQKGLGLWYKRLDAERTFYHEVGHHVLDHMEGGQVREQEEEADDYARSMLRVSRPVLVSFGKAVTWVFRPILRKAVSKVKKRKHPAYR